MLKVTRVDGLRHSLGESPIWSAAEQAFYWVDGLEPVLYRMDWASRAITRTPCPALIGSIALGCGGSIVGALADGFHRLPSGGTRWQRIASPPGRDAGTRFNDGKADRRGRFLAGTMDLGEREPKGVLYSLAADGSVAEIDTGYVVFNGPCWSGDNRTLFTSDSSSRTVWRFAYDIETGTVSDKTRLLQLSEADGLPDGATVDAADRYWQARNGAGKIVRHDLLGRVEIEIAMPTINVTSLAFGGPDLDVLIVTSMDRLLPGQTALDAEAGSVFLVEGLDARGIQEPEVRA